MKIVDSLRVLCTIVEYQGYISKRTEQVKIKKWKLNVLFSNNENNLWLKFPKGLDLYLHTLLSLIIKFGPTFYIFLYLLAGYMIIPKLVAKALSLATNTPNLCLPTYHTNHNRIFDLPHPDKVSTPFI